MTLQDKNFKDLDELVDYLVIEFKKQGVDEHVKKNGIAHHGAGTYLRNELCLWWYEGHKFDTWPKEKPAIVAWFNERNIVRADDMSGTISAAVKAKLKGEEFDFDKHVERYFLHWKGAGFPDGIPKNEI